MLSTLHAGLRVRPSTRPPPRPRVEARVAPTIYGADDFARLGRMLPRERGSVSARSFRGAQRTRNLEIPGLVLTHHPGMREDGSRFAPSGMTTGEGGGVSARRPGESRDPYAGSSRLGNAADAFSHNQRSGVMGPGFRR